MLQTAQRLGAAVGIAVLSAVFYAGAAGFSAEHGPRRSADYGNAFAAALAVSLVFTAAALALAVFDAHRTQRPVSLPPGSANPATRG
jgi:hypothetical protein